MTKYDPHYKNKILKELQLMANKIQFMYNEVSAEKNIKSQYRNIENLKDSIRKVDADYDRLIDSAKEM